ncbi:hypothetical protein E3N88_25520 [Mikania micrantha]|uniref:Uncharacterized protein n=1 Tax=Mikania micrantha TaxID=192012 RepID=A0A5N6N5W8_9ASTR|nr:hypothetical protein E3N88_25520 [Mikania micrantha]
MKTSFFSHKILATIFLCCLIATTKAEEVSTKSPQEGNANNHHHHYHPKRHTSLCFRCRLLYKGPLPPPIIPEKMDTIFNIEKRLVPGVKDHAQLTGLKFRSYQDSRASISALDDSY